MPPSHQPSWPPIYTTHTTTRPPRCIDPPAKAALPAPHTCTAITPPNYTSYTVGLHCRAYTASSLSPFPSSRMLPSTPPGHGHMLACACPSLYCISTLSLSQQSAHDTNLPTSKMNTPTQTLLPPSRPDYNDPYTMLAPRPDTSMHYSSPNHTDLHYSTDPKPQHIKMPHKASSEHPPSWPSPDSSSRGHSSTSPTTQSPHHNQTTSSGMNTAANTALMKSATPHKLPSLTTKLPQPHTNTHIELPRVTAQGTATAADSHSKPQRKQRSCVVSLLGLKPTFWGRQVGCCTVCFTGCCPPARLCSVYLLDSISALLASHFQLLHYLTQSIYPTAACT